MTDVHSHIMFNVDDGCTDIDESIELIRNMKKIGFDNIILTPHYISGTEYKSNHYRVPNSVKIDRLKKLQDVLSREKIDINLFLGNEIFISNDIVDLIEKDEIHPLANTNYILVEFAFNNVLLNFQDVLYEIENKGYTPIIAHPERYSYFHRNYKLVDDLRKDGVLFQCNYSSILGYYGRNAKKLMKYMLKKQYVDYLGTDIHHIKKMDVIDEFDKIEKKILKYAKEDYYNIIKMNCDNLIK